MNCGERGRERGKIEGEKVRAKYMCVCMYTCMYIRPDVLDSRLCYIKGINHLLGSRTILLLLVLVINKVKRTNGVSDIFQISER